MKNKDVTTIYTELAKLAEDVTCEWPRKVSWAIAKNLKVLKDYTDLFGEEQKKLLDEYGERDENGDPTYLKDNIIRIKKEYIKDYAEKINELLNVDVDFKPYMVKLDELPENIQPSHMSALEFMIEE